MEANQNAVTQHHQLSILSQKNYEKLSLHSSSSGAASCKSEFSENTDLPVGSCQPAHRKDEERTYEAILVEDDRTMEKGIFSELDNEVDKVDNSSSSRSNNLKESAIGVMKQSFSVSERQTQMSNDRDYVDCSGSRWQSGIAASQRKVQQISDPVQQILIQLHKIIFITQLLQGSPDLIEPNIFTADGHGVHLSSGGNMLLPDGRKGILGTSGMAEGMIHEQLQVSLLSKGNKEKSSRKRECVILNDGFGIAPNEVNLYFCLYFS